MRALLLLAACASVAQGLTTQTTQAANATMTPEAYHAAQAAKAPSIGQLASPGRPAMTPLPAGKRRVCVFDFDDTLKVEGPTSTTPNVAADARWAVQACIARGYEVAIASAGCKAPFLKTFLQRRVDGDIFNDAFFASPAFQTCVLDKTVSMTRIVQHFGLDDARQCAILFDDIFYNIRYATSIGAGGVFVDNGDLEFKYGERGITVDHVNQAEQKWAKTCPQ